MKILIASRNVHKIREIREIFSLPSVEWVSAADIPGLPDVEENGDTFEANARKKATELAAASGLWALADDSGLEVDALGGAPGVHSARYAGEPCDHARNNDKLLAALADVPPEKRTARFRCVAALASPDGTVRTVSGTCPGHIATERHGAAGFGYDPLFIPEGETQTFAELGPEIKNSMSHRGRAMARAKAEWGPLTVISARVLSPMAEFCLSNANVLIILAVFCALV